MLIANTCDPDREIQYDSPLTQKIQHEIFDKSIEDIERIFNFKINSMASLENENTSCSTSTNRKRKFEDHIDGSNFSTNSSSFKTSTENSRNNKLQKRRYNEFTIRPPASLELRRNPRDKFYTNEKLMNCIYLQDFNFLRDDLLDELFDLNESMNFLK